MNPDRYCREKAAPQGSSLHYSLLSLDEETRRGIIAVHALGRALLAHPQEQEDNTPAAARLAWWTAEIDRLLAGAPRHPATRALLPHLPQPSDARPHLLGLLQAAQNELESPAWPDRESLRQHQRIGVGSLAWLQALLCKTPAPESMDSIIELARFEDLVTRLRDVGSCARKGVLVFPLQVMDEHGVEPEELLRANPGTAVGGLLESEADHAETLYRTMLRRFPDRAANKPTRVMARLRLALLEEIRAGGFQVLDRRTELTPLRKFWIAVRTR